MSWTLTTSGAAIAKAGTDANTTVIASNALLASWSDQVEGRIVASTRKNWVGDYASVNTYVKQVLDETASLLIGMEIVGYDTSGYAPNHAQLMLDRMRDVAFKNLKVLEDWDSNSIKSLS